MFLNKRSPYDDESVAVCFHYWIEIFKSSRLRAEFSLLLSPRLDLDFA